MRLLLQFGEFLQQLLAMFAFPALIVGCLMMTLTVYLEQASLCQPWFLWEKH